MSRLRSKAEGTDAEGKKNFAFSYDICEKFILRRLAV